MTNYEIIKQLEYIKNTTNQKIDMLISRLQVAEEPKKSVATVVTNRPIRNSGERAGWTEMTSQQVEMPNITM